MIQTVAPFKLRVALRRGFAQWHRSKDPEDLIVFTVERDGEAEAVIACGILETNIPLSYETAKSLTATEHEGPAETGTAPVVSETTVPRAYEPAKDLKTVSLPPYVTTALREAIPNGVTVWLEFDEPPGYLPVLPWEALLFELGRYAVVRIAPGDVAPVMPAGDIDSILCFSSPLRARSKEAAAKRLVETFFELLPQTDRQVRLHVFADAQTRPLLRAQKRRFSPSLTVRIYEPTFKSGYLERFEEPDKKRTREAKRTAPSSPRDNPWLRWMRTKLRNYSAEYVHFVCDGRLGEGNGTLAFGAPIVSDDPRWARSVSARELNHFLVTMGAFSVAFSVPPTGASVEGLRYFVYDLSRMRTGPVFLHDMAADRQRNALRAGYRYTMESNVFSGSPALAIYWNPNRSVLDAERRGKLDQLTIADVVEARPETAGSIVRLHRSLEATATRLTAEPSTALAKAIQSGRERGLDFASDVIKRRLVDDDTGSESSR